MTIPMAALTSGPMGWGVRWFICLWLLLSVLAGCADGTDSGAGELPTPKAMVLDEVEVRRMEESPQPPADVARSTSSTVSRDEVPDAHGLWVVSRTANAEGTFMLVRNVTHASREGTVIRATRGEGDGETLGPRGTAVWECGAAEVPLTLQTDDGTVIYEAALTCGDAVYVRRSGAALGSIR